VLMRLQKNWRLYTLRVGVKLFWKDSLAVTDNVKFRIPRWPGNSTPRWISGELKTSLSKNSYTNVYSILIYNC
jgi:hypothetical protein